MLRQGLAAAALAVALIPAGVEAQRGEITEFAFGRGRIGIMVDMKADEATDRLGARIQSVIPGGPAAEAGLKAGDIITRFNGTSLAGLASDDADLSGPAQKLVELAGELDRGDEVTLQYRRGEAIRTVELKADNVMGGFAFRGNGPSRFRSFGGPDVEFFPRGEFEFRPHVEQWLTPLKELHFGMGPGGLDLAELNQDLSTYFGTAEGALVMQAPADSSLKLKGGDVIVAIDGRQVQTPAHARRILGSYEPGETASIEVLRQRNRTTVNWTVPERGARGRFYHERDEAKPRTRSRARA